MDSSHKPGWLLRLVGISALSMALCSHILCRCTENLDSTVGTITGSSLNQVLGLDEPLQIDESGRAKLNTNGAVYVRVHYRYHVDGTTYFRETQSDVATFAESSGLAGEFKTGRTLTVFYNPDDPYQSLIWREKPPSETFLIWLGLTSFGLALLCGRFQFLSRLFDISVGEEEELEPISPDPEPRFVILSQKAAA